MIATVTTNVRRIAFSAMGALLVSAGIASAPAFAADLATPNAPLTIADWQAKVGAQLEDKLRMPKNALRNRDHLVGTVTLSFADDGTYTGASISKRSGSRAIDAEMVRVASTMSYPPLPAGLRGRPQTVALQAYFGQGWTQEALVREQSAAKALASSGRTKHDAVQTAALPSG